jgi:hypothetical protein
VKAKRLTQGRPIGTSGSVTTTPEPPNLAGDSGWRTEGVADVTVVIVKLTTEEVGGDTDAGENREKETGCQR